MFEEDFDRCFICQAPSKGLYCSSECRQKDKGSDSPATRADGDAPVRITAQLPASLSPMVRPVHHIQASPFFPGRRRTGTTSSSSSSLSDDPIQSPQTNPSGSDSPPREGFNLPPPAYPMNNNAFLAGSVPVKIPYSLASRVPSNPATGSTTPTTAASIDTLRFGRKSSVTNSVTSPLALAPRCGCGRQLGHRSRSRDPIKEATEHISCLNLGPSQTTNHNEELRSTSSMRMVSDPSNRAPRTPILPCPTLPEERSISTVLGSSLLSRSRSDPAHPPSPRARMAAQAAVGIHPRPSLELVGLTPPKVSLPPVAPTHGTRSRSAAPMVDDHHRGRSRERVKRVDMTPELPRAQLLYHEDREVAPQKTSRSRVRTSRSRDREGRGRERTSRSRTRFVERDDEYNPNRGRALAA